MQSVYSRCEWIGFFFFSWYLTLASGSALLALTLVFIYGKLFLFLGLIDGCRRNERRNKEKRIKMFIKSLVQSVLCVYDGCEVHGMILTLYAVILFSHNVNLDIFILSFV